MIKNMIEYFRIFFYRILIYKSKNRNESDKSEKPDIKIQIQDNKNSNKKRKFEENCKNIKNIKRAKLVSKYEIYEIKIEIKIKLDNDYVLSDYINNYQGIEV